WVDRNHAVATLEQILEGEIARPAGIGRNADHRDRLHGVEDAADVAVVVAVVVHGSRLRTEDMGARARGKGGGCRRRSPPHRSSQGGSRFSTKAAMPSSASRVIMFCTITSVACS